LVRTTTLPRCDHGGGTEAVYVRGVVLSAFGRRQLAQGARTGERARGLTFTLVSRERLGANVAGFGLSRVSLLGGRLALSATASGTRPDTLLVVPV